MCHFDYRKFDSCGDYGIEISRICDDALWRAGIEGELRICVPRILERSLEWSGLDHHEPPKPALFRGYDGYCEMCAARFKVCYRNEAITWFSVFMLITKCHSYQAPYSREATQTMSSTTRDR